MIRASTLGAVSASRDGWRQLGFVESAGELALVQGGARVLLRGERLCLVDDSNRRASADCLRGALGRAGPWRLVPTASGSVWQADLGVLSSIDPQPAPADEEDEPPAIANCRWALATLAGLPPSDWRAPAASELRLESNAVRPIARASSLLAEGEWTMTANRLTLTMPLGAVQPDLAPERRQWLELVLRSGLTRWRWVRIGLDGADRVLVQIDLSGAPREPLAELCARASAAVICAARDLLPRIALLTDVGAACAALDRPLFRGSTPLF